MSGVYGYPQSGSQVAVSRMIAAALLVVAAALALGGSFAAFSIYRFESEVLPSSTTTTTGWGDVEEPVSEEGPAAPDVLHGIPLSVGAVLALVAAVLLVASARRPGDPAPGRLLGTGAAGLLVGVVAVIWLELVTATRNVAVNNEAPELDDGIRLSFQIGAGGYLILAGALSALVAGALLLVPRRSPGSAPVPPWGPGPPQWPGAPQPWAPPGVAMPPQGWGPPPHHG